MTFPQPSPIGPQLAFTSAHVFGLQVPGGSPASPTGANPPLDDVFPLLLLLLAVPLPASGPPVNVLVLSLPHAATVRAAVPSIAATICQRMEPPSDVASRMRALRPLS
jgi:hypothetical protein